MKKNPLVSVVMPVYNAERFVAESIESILRQTFTDFEFIIVDDGSTDRTPEIVRSFTDERIRYERFEENCGFIDALEYGIKKANGKWIARMDADDISFPQRLEKQIHFLNDHPECVFVGTIYHLISPSGKLLNKIIDPIECWRYVNKEMLTFDQRRFADPSVIFSRTAAIKVKLYDHDILFENPLWYKLLTIGRGAELFEALHLYRIHLGALSKKKRERPIVGMYRDAWVRYDLDNAKKHKYFYENSWPDQRTRRIISIISAMRMCHVTGDRQTAWKIFKEIQPEFGLDPALLKILVKGVLGVKNLSPFTHRHPEKYKEIKLDWYNYNQLHDK